MPTSGGQGVEPGPELVGGRLTDAGLEAFVADLPDRHGAGEQGVALGGERHAPAPPVGLIDHRRHQAAPHQGLERRSEGGAIGAEQGGDLGDAGRLGAVEGVEQGKLPAGQVQGPQSGIETAGQSAGGALGAQAKALVADEVGGGDRVGD